MACFKGLLLSWLRRKIETLEGCLSEKMRLWILKLLWHLEVNYMFVALPSFPRVKNEEFNAIFALRNQLLFSSPIILGLLVFADVAAWHLQLAVVWDKSSLPSFTDFSLYSCSFIRGHVPALYVTLLEMVLVDLLCFNVYRTDDLATCLTFLTS